LDGVPAPGPVQLINQTTGITQNSLNITLGSNRGEYQ